MLCRDAENHLRCQLSFRLQPVGQGRTVAFPAIFVELVGANTDSLFQSVEAGIQPAEKRLPFLKRQKRRNLSAALRRLRVSPKGGQNPFFPRFGLAENEKERIITLVVCSPSFQSNRPRNRKAVLPFIRIALEHMVDSVLQFPPAFLANADCAPIRNGNRRVVNRDSFGGMIIGTTYS